MMILFIIISFFKISRINRAFIILNLLNFNLFNCILILALFSNINLSKCSFSSHIYDFVSINCFWSLSSFSGCIFHFNKILEHFLFLLIIHGLNFGQSLIIFIPIFIITNVNEGTKYFWRKNISKCFSIFFYWIKVS